MLWLPASIDNNDLWWLQWEECNGLIQVLYLKGLGTTTSYGSTRENRCHWVLSFTTVNVSYMWTSQVCVSSNIDHARRTPGTRTCTKTLRMNKMSRLQRGWWWTVQCWRTMTPFPKLFAFFFPPITVPNCSP